MKDEQQISVSEFKAKALRILEQVARTGRIVVVTKRGRPLARVGPIAPRKAAPGRLAHLLRFEKDIVSPLGSDDWEAAR